MNVSLVDATMSELIAEARSDLTRLHHWAKGVDRAEPREMILLCGEVNAIVATIMNRVAVGELAERGDDGY